MDRLKQEPQFRDCDEEELLNGFNKAINEVTVSWRNKKATPVFKEALQELFLHWRNNDMYERYENIYDLETFKQYMYTMIGDIIEDEENVKELFMSLQKYMMFIYILYDYCNLIIENPDIKNEKKVNVLKMLNHYEYYSDYKQTAIKELQLLQDLFNSSDSEILETPLFRRVLRYLNGSYESDDDKINNVFQALLLLFENQSVIDLKKMAESLVDNVTCDYNEYFMASSILFVMFNYSIIEKDEVFRVYVNEPGVIADGFDKCSVYLFEKAYDMVIRIKKIKTFENFLVRQNDIIEVFKKTHFFDGLESQEQLLSVLKKIFSRIKKEDELMKIANVINRELDLMIVMLEEDEEETNIEDKVESFVKELLENNTIDLEKVSMNQFIDLVIEKLNIKEDKKTRKLIKNIISTQVDLFLQAKREQTLKNREEVENIQKDREEEANKQDVNAIEIEEKYILPEEKDEGEEESEEEIFLSPEVSDEEEDESEESEEESEEEIFLSPEVSDEEEDESEEEEDKQPVTKEELRKYRLKVAKKWAKENNSEEDEDYYANAESKIKISFCNQNSGDFIMKVLFMKIKSKGRLSNQEIYDQLRSNNDYKLCTDDMYKELVEIAEEEIEASMASIGNINDDFKDDVMTMLFKRALIKLLVFWRLNQLYVYADPLKTIEGFTEMIRIILGSDVSNNDEYVEKIYRELQGKIIYGYVIYLITDIIISENESLLDEEDYDIYEALADKNVYLRECEDSAILEIKRLKNFFNSDDDSLFSKPDFNRVLNYLYSEYGFSDEDTLLAESIKLFRYQDESLMTETINNFLERQENPSENVCDYDGYYIVSLLFQGLINGDISVKRFDFNEELIKEYLFQVNSDVKSCSEETINDAIGLFRAMIRAQTLVEVNLLSNDLRGILKHMNTYFTSSAKTLLELLKIIEKIFSSVPKKDVYIVAKFFNEEMKLGLNDKYILNPSSVNTLDTNMFVKYESLLRDIFKDMTKQYIIKSEDSVDYFSNKQASPYFVKTDETGVYSIVKVNKYLKNNDFIYSYNHNEKELRMTTEFELNDYKRFVELSESDQKLYQIFYICLMATMLEKREFSHFSNIIESIYVSTKQTQEYTFEIFGGVLKLNLRKIVLIPTGWYPVVCSFLTPGAYSLEDASIISSYKAEKQSEIFDIDGKVKDEYSNNISFTLNPVMTEQPMVSLYNVIASNNESKAHTMLAQISKNTFDSLFKTKSLENIPTKYAKILIESMLFNNSAYYNFTSATYGIYQRLRKYFEHNYCNLIDSYTLLPPLFSTEYSDIPKQFDIQIKLTDMVQQIDNKNCLVYARNPATLSQIEYVVSNGYENKLINLIKKWIQIDETTLRNIIKTSKDDLEFYVNLRNYYMKNVPGERDMKQIDASRGRKRANDLRRVLRDMNTSSNFLYIDFGAGDGAITKQIAGQMRLSKNQAFACDVENWYGNIHKQEYQDSISYEIIKPRGELSFKDGSVDLITCFQVLHHVDDIDFTVEQLVRKLRTGGVLVIREHDCDNDITRVLIDVEHSLFETSMNKEGINARQLFEYSDTEKYKSVREWDEYFSRKGLVLEERYRDLYNIKPIGETRYTYRVYKKKEE